MRYASLAPHQVCRFCRRPLSWRELGTKSCLSLDCLHEVGKAHREVERREHAALVEQVRNLRDRAAVMLDITSPESYPLAVIPSFPVEIAILSEERRTAFRTLVLRLIDNVLAAPGSGDSAHAHFSEKSNREPLPVALQAVLNQACAMCRGACCRNGGNHAYLTEETIARIVERQAGQGREQILEAYLGFVGERTTDGSCIYHGSAGCTLPRDLRSDTCNQFYCTGLRDYQRELNRDGPARAFLASASGQELQAAAFFDENGTRTYLGSHSHI